MDIRCPFEFCGIGVPSADVAGLKLLELLLRSEFVGLDKKGYQLSIT